MGTVLYNDGVGPVGEQGFVVMRGVWKSLLALLLCVAAGSSPLVAAPCHDQALGELRRLHPLGFNVYVSMRKKSDFLQWVTCDDVQLGLTTAVHESVHMLTHEMNAYPLINGSSLPRIEASAALYPPSQLSPRYDGTSAYVSTYLHPGGATSAEEFGYLLDELNAYSHDLHAAVGLQSLAPRGRAVFHRDGLAALMSFVAAYVDEAFRNHPSTWRLLVQPNHRKTVGGLWTQAEQVLGDSCRMKDFSDEAPRFLVNVCSATFHGGLGQLLGRPPVCPVRCARAGLARVSR